MEVVPHLVCRKVCLCVTLHFPPHLHCYHVLEGPSLVIVPIHTVLHIRPAGGEAAAAPGHGGPTTGIAHAMPHFSDKFGGDLFTVKQWLEQSKLG